MKAMLGTFGLSEKEKELRCAALDKMHKEDEENEVIYRRAKNILIALLEDYRRGELTRQQFYKYARSVSNIIPSSMVFPDRHRVFSWAIEELEMKPPKVSSRKKKGQPPSVRRYAVNLVRGLSSGGIPEYSLNSTSNRYAKAGSVFDAVARMLREDGLIDVTAKSVERWHYDDKNRPRRR